MSSEVYIVQAGAYEDWHVVLVAESLEAAVAAIKASYGHPYRVEWDDVRADSNLEGWSLMGHFAAVRGYSTQHDNEFDITRWPVAKS